MAKVLDAASFSDFLKYIKFPHQRNEIIIILSFYAIAFVVFVNLYPFPATLTDSANYVYCAKMQQPGGYRPYGYSWFLDFVHSFVSALWFVTFIQFLLTALSTLFFAYTIKYFFKSIPVYLWYGFLFLLVIAPPTLYMSHSLLSDSLFCSLTVLWFTAGIWIIFTQNFFMYALHILALYWALEVRYTGLFYPAFTFLIVFMSFKKFQYKLGLSAVCLIMVMYFYKSTKSQMKRDFSIETFSGFSGWQLASNSLHVIPYVKLEPQQARDEQTRVFLQFIVQSDKSIYNGGVSAHLMWHKESPLKLYTYWKMQAINVPYLQAWLLCGKDFSKFGSYLIKQYPVEFFKYYLLPNAWNLLYPPSDRGAIARIEDITVDDMFNEYYGLEKGKKFSENRSTLFTKISPALSFGNLILCISFIGSAFFLLIKRKSLSLTKEQSNCLVFLALFAFGYAGFNIFAGPFEYRYIIPIRPILILLPLILITTVFITNKSLKKS
jgi:hypothetical protein